ncbi:MAG: 23S rRNA (adenine(2503)-C(2))-methyltransferase RlmN [Candidatus Aminicenantes bacterium]|nr:23S rRNA (adenine(2503)-C(2))-methyltransferase RlmN [Candidatus Aminicenantes bacterium]
MLKWIYDLSYDELKEDVCKLKMPGYVADQIFQWLYEKSIDDIAAWSNISKQNRSLLSRKFNTRPDKIIAIEENKEGTGKFLIQLIDGSRIEAVLIREKKHLTLCISTQVGCALKCKFCATGIMGFKRNLTCGEILCQVLLVKREAAASLPQQKRMPKVNIVFMGMGEPLLNYENLKKALAIITSGKGIGILPRNITVSTAGILAGIKRLEEDFTAIKVGFSLNSPDATLREELMPVSKREKLSEILTYFKNTSRKHRLTFEYVLIKGVNDSLKDAGKVSALLRGIPCKINLIPYNENGNIDYETPSAADVEAFCEYLCARNYTVMIRWSKGRDIKSACGQLAVEI